MSSATKITLCHIDDIPESDSRGFNTGGQAIFAVKKDACIYVYRNQCPHLGIELEWKEDQFLDSEGMLIQCSTHGALFVIDSGECVAGPCLGKALIPIAHEIVDAMLVIDLLHTG